MGVTSHRHQFSAVQLAGYLPVIFLVAPAPFFQGPPPLT